jgi:hypothetical protein
MQAKSGTIKMSSKEPVSKRIRVSNPDNNTRDVSVCPYVDDDDRTIFLSADGEEMDREESENDEGLAAYENMCDTQETFKRPAGKAAITDVNAIDNFVEHMAVPAVWRVRKGRPRHQKPGTYSPIDGDGARWYIKDGTKRQGRAGAFTSLPTAVTDMILLLAISQPADLQALILCCHCFANHGEKPEAVAHTAAVASRPARLAKALAAAVSIQALTEATKADAKVVAFEGGE